MYCIILALSLAPTSPHVLVLYERPGVLVQPAFVSIFQFFSDHNFFIRNFYQATIVKASGYINFIKLFYFKYFDK